MKKLLATLLALTVMAATIFALASCKEKDSDGEQDGNGNGSTVQNPGGGNNQPVTSDDDNNIEEKPGGNENDKDEVDGYSKGLAYTSNDDGTCYVSGIGTCTDSKIVIPSVSPEGERVTGIGSVAFMRSLIPTSVVIPESVIDIGDFAFYGCNMLTSIDIPDGVVSIGEEAFRFCFITDVIIGRNVKSIGNLNFNECPYLTNIEVDENNSEYKSIDGNLYTKDGKTLIKYATGKTDSFFIIPNSVESIGHSAFYGCTTLTSVAIPNSTTFVTDYAFLACTNLDDVYYTGTEEEWAAITVGSDNEYLTSATIHFGYVPEK